MVAPATTPATTSGQPWRVFDMLTIICRHVSRGNPGSHDTAILSVPAPLVLRGPRTGRAGDSQAAQGSYFPSWLLQPRRRAEQALLQVVADCYLAGVPTRRVDKLVQQLGLDGLSKSQRRLPSGSGRTLPRPRP